MIKTPMVDCPNCGVPCYIDNPIPDVVTLSCASMARPSHSYFKEDEGPQEEYYMGFPLKSSYQLVNFTEM